MRDRASRDTWFDPKPIVTRASLACLRLGLMQLRVQPLRTSVNLLTLACGIALCYGIFLVNAVALNEFSLATRRLAGEADIIVKGPRGGFAEQLYPGLAARAEVRLASPVLEVDVAIAGSRASLPIQGVDAFRAGALQPAIIGAIAGDVIGLFQANRIYLSVAAARLLGVAAGESFDVRVGAATRRLEVRGILPADSYPGVLGIMDIAAAQWTLGQLGRINRIDLQLVPGTDVGKFRRELAAILPAGVLATSPGIEAQRVASMSRAYRVNLTMLALVSLLTAALLLFATQTFSVLRRRTSLALLRALGATRGDLQVALLAEGALLGVIGSVVGVALGYAMAALLLTVFGASLAASQQAVTVASLRLEPWALALFVLLGTLVAALGSWIPAREAANRAPARALKAGDAELAMAKLRPTLPGVALLVAAAVLAVLPAWRGIPVFGYLSIATLLLGGLLLVPASTLWLLARLPQGERPSISIGIAQIRGNVAQLQVSLAPVIVSFSLMAAMAIMVHSFRESFDHWLQQSLPADIQLRTPPSDSRILSAADQQQLAGLSGIASVQFQRSVQLLLSVDNAPVLLSARDRVPTDSAASLVLVSESFPAPAGKTAVWVSEAVHDRLGLRAGTEVMLPIGGRPTPVFVAGVFRDYGRPGGVIVIDRRAYRQLTGDRSATEAAIWLQPRANNAAVIGTLRKEMPDGQVLEIRSSDEVRQISMRIFDSAFSITHALEAVAVLIGLVGIACAGASTALARRAEFGMLRHLGMLRRQIVTMLAAEGFAMSALAALYGLLLGAAISIVLVEVVNRQSFNWSIDFAVPFGQLAAFVAALLLAATLTNVVSARAAVKVAALRAVREDW